MGHGPTSERTRGEECRVALCRLLLAKPDIPPFEKPSNHLDSETVQWLEQPLQRYGDTVLAVTHNLDVLDNVAGWNLEFDRGQGAWCQVRKQPNCELPARLFKMSRRRHRPPLADSGAV